MAVALSLHNLREHIAINENCVKEEVVKSGGSYKLVG